MTRDVGDRDATSSAIKDAGRRLLRTRGETGVGMRAIAREVGMPVSSLYRFYADRSELVTDLRTEAYENLVAGLADARDASQGPAAVDRWCAMAHALRAWRTANPDEFALLYSPAGSECGARAPQVHQQRMSPAALFADTVSEAVATGELMPRAGINCVHEGTQTWRDRRGVPVTPAVVHLVMSGWSAMIGYLCLEPARSALTADPDQQFTEFLRVVTTGMGFGERKRPPA
ncbi:TetR/AcrR family transcriptional regulator [Luteipulveratus halotolerans]|uniref:TetR/AcrR family transcriptional regulator n=1 Tax=Luteipulveratus halotolerans TaxID=1631356 RepID=UPI0006821CE7|nr:TetR/AcrR family transcriptional regulator [Luteipulveratus halotolerans]